MRSHTLALAGFALTAAAQNQTLLEALSSQPALSNLTTYLSLFPEILSEIEGMSNITILAPNNDAFEQARGSDAGIPGTSELLSALFSYHVLEGTYTDFAINSTFIPTALLPGDYANVTGGQRVQAIGATDQTTSNGLFYSGLLQNATTVEDMAVASASNMTTNSTASANSTESSNSTESTDTRYATTFAGGVIFIIDHFLTIPENLTNTAVQLNLQSAVGALTITNLSEPLDMMTDVTAFIPHNAAFQAIGGLLATSTIEEIANILEYHVVNGSVLYSTDLTNNSTLTAMNGIGLDITIDGDSVFVNSAKVLTPNVLVANGVIHVIDNVLNPGNRTAEPVVSASTQAPAFANATSASDVPYTSGVATATSMIYTEAPSSATSAAAATSTSSAGGAMPRQTGAVAAAALFGGVAAYFNM